MNSPRIFWILRRIPYFDCIRYALCILFLRYFFCELAIIEISIEAILAHEFLVVALLDNISIFHHENQIRISDSGQAMGNDKGSSALHEFVHGFLNQLFCSGIDR